MEARRFSGKTVNEATDLALEELGVNREDVEISVVSAGRSGILGFGGEPAVIEVTLIGSVAPAAPAGVREPPSRERRDRSRTRRSGAGRRRQPPGTGGGGTAAVDDRETQQPESRSAPAVPEVSVDEFAEDIPESEPLPPGERDTEAEALVAQLLDYFLASMGVVATTYVRDDLVHGALAFDIEGEDSGLLIGRRGETLQALQFLVNMIVSRQLGRRVHVIIDVEGYRERRFEMLESLARRTASRVADSGRPSRLDPMPAAERRIIHMTLANHPQVRTESEGDGSERRVVVLPKR